MNRPTVVHLVDDTTAGGVMRVLDHILTAQGMSDFAQHSLISVDRKSMSLGHINADIIVSHLAISWRTLPMLFSLRLRHPKTALVHVEHSYTQGFVDENVTHKRRFFTLLRLAFNLFNRVVAVSNAQGEWLIESGAVKATSLQVIRSCVDLSAFRKIKTSNKPVKVIGAIGRLDKQKGFDDLIQAFRQTLNQNLELHFYGEGDQELALRALAEGDTRIKFHGFVADPLDAMRTVDVVAMPSRWEAYGLVAIEALAAGRELLVNDVDGLRDHLAYGAVLVPDASINSWTKAINQVSEQDRNTSPSHFQGNECLEACFSEGWKELITNLIQQAATPT